MNSRTYILLFMAVLWAMVSGCRQALTPDEYRIWIQKNQKLLVAEAACNDLRFVLEYIPGELETHRNQGRVDTEKFILTVNRQDRARGSARSFAVYAESQMAEDLSLIQGEDTIPCLAVQPEASFLDANSNRAIILFNARLSQNNKPVRVLYADKIFRCNQKLLFDFKNLRVKTLPTIKSPLL